MEIDPAALLEPLYQTGVGEQAQMAGNSRLALAQDLGQILDIQLPGGKQQQNPQTGGLRSGFQGAQYRLGCQCFTQRFLLKMN